LNLPKLWGLALLIIVEHNRIAQSTPTDLQMAGSIAGRAAAFDVGVTIDLGTGLYVPVVTDVAARSLDDIADSLTNFSMGALRRRLSEQDPGGAVTAISPAIEEGIVLVQPAIPPGLLAIVSLAAPQERASPDGRGGLSLPLTIDIGLRYHHRFVSSRESAAS
jgi:2-oxoglutarate dehydrogenase E2 component (dihydrolipoamide succinyltransferase)